MFFSLLQHETQKVIALSSSLTHYYWDPGGLACSFYILPIHPELPVFRGLHDQHPGSCPACWGSEPQPQQVPEVT